MHCLIQGLFLGDYSQPSTSQASARADGAACYDAAARRFSCEPSS